MNLFEIILMNTKPIILKITIFRERLFTTPILWIMFTITVTSSLFAQPSQWSARGIGGGESRSVIDRRDRQRRLQPAAARPVGQRLEPAGQVVRLRPGDDRVPDSVGAGGKSGGCATS